MITEEVQYQILLWSLGINFITMFCLFSPNIVYFIHKKWFKWRHKQ